MTAKIKLNAASGGGSFSLQAPSSSANNRVMTLPDTADGTILTTTNPKAGNIIQVVSTTKTDTVSNSTASQTWWSYTDTSLRATITPSSASNKILLMAQIMWSEASGQWYQFRLEQDGAELAGAIGDAASSRTRVTAQQDGQSDNNAGRTMTLIAQVSAGNTNSRYYNIALRHTSGATRTLLLNRTGLDNDQYSYGRGISTITAMEIAA